LQLLICFLKLTATADLRGELALHGCVLSREELHGGRILFLFRPISYCQVSFTPWVDNKRDFCYMIAKSALVKVNLELHSYVALNPPRPTMPLKRWCLSRRTRVSVASGTALFSFSLDFHIVNVTTLTPEVPYGLLPCATHWLPLILCRQGP
jgi:hypothetical protein